MPAANETVTAIIWAFHPREGIPLFRLVDSNVIHHIGTEPCVDGYRTEVCFAWVCATWSKDMYVGVESCCKTNLDKYQLDAHSKIWELQYVQVDSRIFGNQTENDWSFHSIWQLERQALYRQANYDLYGQAALIRLLPSSRLARHVNL